MLYTFKQQIIFITYVCHSKSIQLQEYCSSFHKATQKKKKREKHYAGEATNRIENNQGFCWVQIHR